MEKQNRMRAMELVWPLFAGLGFILKIADKIFLRWWLDPLLQSRANEALWDDVRATLAFPCAKEPERVEKRLAILPFDYASVHFVLDNLQFCVTRGRGELNLSLSPRYAPGDMFELSMVIAALDSIDLTEVSVPNDLPGLGDLVSRRLSELNDVFSEDKYPAFKEKLLKVKKNAQILTRQGEWELNKKLYR